ncbi:MAG: sialate O-acetylesterase, partial [Verrucomicrobiaceae bacterium]
EEGQFYTRDDKNEGTLFYNGTITEGADSVFLKLYADDKLVKTETGRVGPDKSYALTAKLRPGLIRYKVEFGTKSGVRETVLEKVGNLVCGDAYLIDGQSNALALDTGENSPPESREWIRSYGGPKSRGDESGWADRFANGKHENLWSNPIWKGPGKVELGWWGMELAKRLLASQKVPICIIQAAEGGTRIDEHKRNEANHTDLKTLYGHMLWRIEHARLTHGIRAVLWHQGESDQGSDGPDGGYGWETYHQYFLDMSAEWKQDMPNIRHYYVYQIWPNACSMGNSHGDMLREVLRTLPSLYSNMSIMSTHGIKPPGGCHFPLTGWSEFARLIQPLIERDNYGKVPTASITPPNLKRVAFAAGAKDTVLLEFDQPVVWSDALTGEFYLDGEKGKVASGSVAGNVLTLKLKEPSAATKITYLKEMSWSQETLLNGANGIAALTFCDVPIATLKN